MDDAFKTLTYEATIIGIGVGRFDGPCLLLGDRCALYVDDYILNKLKEHVRQNFERDLPVFYWDEIENRWVLCEKGDEE